MFEAFRTVNERCKCFFYLCHKLYEVLSPILMAVTLFRGNPTIQGNSILALSGLAVTIVTNDGPMDEKHSFMRYIDTKDWLVKVADTVMVVLDGNFKPKGQPFQWCQQVCSISSLTFVLNRLNFSAKSYWDLEGEKKTRGLLITISSKNLSARNRFPCI